MQCCKQDNVESGCEIKIAPIKETNVTFKINGNSFSGNNNYSYAKWIWTTYLISHPSFFISKKVELEWTQPNSSMGNRAHIAMPKNEKTKMVHVGFFI